MNKPTLICRVNCAHQPSVVWPDAEGGPFRLRLGLDLRGTVMPWKDASAEDLRRHERLTAHTWAWATALATCQDNETVLVSEDGPEPDLDDVWLAQLPIDADMALLRGDVAETEAGMRGRVRAVSEVGAYILSRQGAYRMLALCGWRALEVPTIEWMATHLARTGGVFLGRAG